ncbi:MAG: Rossmann-like and DUF2520 domain-containing protein [Bacteroidota bacterium]
MAENKTIQSIVIIGSGNLASHLSQGFLTADKTVKAIVSRNPIAGRLLATKAKAAYVAKVEDCPADADLILLAVTDAAIEDVANRMPETDAIVVHISGSTNIQAVRRFKNHGVFYPLQSFTKDKAVNFYEIPFLVEGNTPENNALLTDLGHALSTRVFSATTTDRKYLHLAAVFASNFTNALYEASKRILENNTSLPFELLLPLIKETAVRLKDLDPVHAQTGPAKRGEKHVISQQMELLKHQRELTQIYDLITNLIEQQQRNA